MKKTIALIFSIIMLFSLCSCENDSIGSAKKLTAQNFTELCDSDGYLYAYNGEGGPGVFLFNNQSNYVKSARLNDDLSIDYSRLTASRDLIVTSYDDEHFAIEADWQEPAHYKLVYSDPKGEYIVFGDEETSNSNSFAYLTFMSKQLLSSVFEKVKQTTESDYPLSLEQWISFVDSCK